jgi:hypothetical protein
MSISPALQRGESGFQTGASESRRDGAKLFCIKARLNKVRKDSRTTLFCKLKNNLVL